MVGDERETGPARARVPTSTSNRLVHDISHVAVNLVDPHAEQGGTAPNDIPPAASTVAAVSYVSSLATVQRRASTGRDTASSGIRSPVPSMDQRPVTRVQRVARPVYGGSKINAVSLMCSALCHFGV